MSERTELEVERFAAAPDFLAAAGAVPRRAGGRAQPDLRHLREPDRRPGVSELATLSGHGRARRAGGGRGRHDPALEPGPVIDRRRGGRGCARRRPVRGRSRGAGTVGPVEVARAFASRWGRMHGLTTRRAIAERIYRVERVVPPVGVPGHVRIATKVDRDVLVEWVDAFLDEALDRRIPKTPPSWLTDRSEPVREPGTSGTTADRSRSPRPAGRRRTASGSGPSTRRPSDEDAATRAP